MTHSDSPNSALLDLRRNLSPENGHDDSQAALKATLTRRSLVALALQERDVVLEVNEGPITAAGMKMMDSRVREEGDGWPGVFRALFGERQGEAEWLIVLWCQKRG